MCSYCRKIPQIDSFRLQLQRKVKQKDATDEQLMSTNLKYQPHNILVDRVVKLNAEVKACKSRNFLLGSELARTKRRKSSFKDRLEELCKRGNVKGIGYKIEKAYDEGKLKDKASLVSILQTVSQNLTRSKKGKWYNVTYQEFFEVILTLGGPRLCNFISVNLDGPHLYTVMEWRKHRVIAYVLGEHKENILAVSNLYKKAKEHLKIESDVPYLFAEDETAIIPCPKYKPDLDEIWGFCGRKGIDHICEDHFVVKVGDDDNAFERIQNAFENNQVATHARVIMVNPLHAQLPHIVVLLQANCNRFTHNEVLHQWLVLEDLCQTVLDPVLGPGIGHASDGASR